MQTGGDGKGRKCSPEQKERREWVKGVVISGERERLYWQKLNGAKKGR